MTTEWDYLFLNHIGITSFGGCNDYVEELSGGYILISESLTDQFILKKGHKEGDKLIPCTVIAHCFNEQFILAAQETNGGFCAEIATPAYKIHELSFWVIIHAKKQVLGPLSLDEYLQERKLLKIPDDLKLSLEL